MNVKTGHTNQYRVKYNRCLFNEIAIIPKQGI